MPSRAEQVGRWIAPLVLLASCGAPERPSTTASRPVSDTPVKIGNPYQVTGRWYYPLDERGYDEVGLASWYGPQFHGLATANGERFDMDRVGAAHKTLPLPCYVEVTSLDTGRTILVRVNDRGPFVADRIIDLSRGAARLLGVEAKGVARVRVRRVEPAESDRAMLRAGRPASPRSSASASQLAQLSARLAARSIVAAPPQRPAYGEARAPLGIGQYVQVAAFADRLRADALAARLSHPEGARVELAGNLWRVRLGPFFSDDGAREALARVRGQGYQDARLVADPAVN